jgi:hypothetical protein
MDDLLDAGEVDPPRPSHDLRATCADDDKESEEAAWRLPPAAKRWVTRRRAHGLRMLQLAGFETGRAGGVFISSNWEVSSEQTVSVLFLQSVASIESKLHSELTNFVKRSFRIKFP